MFPRVLISLRSNNLPHLYSHFSVERLNSSFVFNNHSLFLLVRIMRQNYYNCPIRWGIKREIFVVSSKKVHFFAIFAKNRAVFGENSSISYKNLCMSKKIRTFARKEIDNENDRSLYSYI